MAGRVSANKQSPNATARRRSLFGVGAGAGVFLAAAAMATGSTVTAAPAKADLDAVLDPIIQPILTSVTDSLAGIDPTLATDLTAWTDSVLADLNSLEAAAAVPLTAAPAASGALPAPSTGAPYDIPITIQEDTEPTVQATVDGADTTLLVDTGSSGLVIPYTDLGSNIFQELLTLLELGFPTGISESGYSGGVEYVYLEYNDVSTDYGNGALDTTGPVDVEIYSYDPSDLSSLFTNDAFQNFLGDNDVTGILGIGDSSSDAGPTVSPFQADGYDDVAVNIPNVPTDVQGGPGELDGDLIVDPTIPGTAIQLEGAPTPSTELTEKVTDGGSLVSTTPVYDDIDSGGVYGTFTSAVPDGDTITVYDGSTPLYSYLVGTDSYGTDKAPEVVSVGGTSQGDPIDSGIEAFLGHEIYIDYTNDYLYFEE